MSSLGSIMPVISCQPATSACGGEHWTEHYNVQVRLDAVDELEPVNMETNEKEQAERPNAVSDKDLHSLLTAFSIKI